MNYSRNIQIENLGEDVRGMKILCDVDRICDIEDSVFDWRLYDFKNHSQKLINPIDVEHMKEYFEILQVHFNESDWHYNKKVLRAIKST
jgi:hypothetical protein